MRLASLTLAVGLSVSVAVRVCHSQDRRETEPQGKTTTTDATTSKKKLLVDPGLATYRRTSGISGSLSSVGSDTLNNLMTLWAEGFQKIYPNVKIQIEGKGSSTAPPALIEGVAQFGPMSRAMKSSEIDKFEAKFGYKPTAIRVAIDALAVYVNKDNPLEEATLQQIDAVFSKNRNGGLPSNIANWGGLGLEGPWAAKAIRLYGRNSASGTYGFFKKVALFKGDYKSTVKEQPGSASVVRSVGEDRWGIGYSGLGYKTSQVKILRIAKKPNKPAYDTSEKNVRKGKYPLARYLYVYINKAPNKSCDSLVSEFVKFVLSKQGQMTVVKDGYLPVTSKLAKKTVRTLAGQ